MATGRNVSQLGSSIVGQYYQKLQLQPLLVHQFYRNVSSMVRVDGNSTLTANTILDIHRIILSLNFVSTQILTVNSLQSWGSGVLVMVSGNVSVRATGYHELRKFVQSFFLAPDGKGFFILNDIFQFLEERSVIRDYAAPQLSDNKLESRLRMSNSQVSGYGLIEEAIENMPSTSYQHVGYNVKEDNGFEKQKQKQSTKYQHLERHGMPYTLEEDAKIMKAVDDYIVVNGLASSDCVDKDLDANWKKARSMVMNCQKHPELRGCWKFISAAITGRTSKSVYERAHFVYDSAAEEHKWWTKEEIDQTLSFHEKKGPKWKELGDSIGKSRKHTRDAYRRNKPRDTKKGAWSQEEHHKLFELVNRDICIKAVQEKKVKHGMLRDNIAWGAISDTLETRTSANCCKKWYNQICSSMVVQGKWLDTDDCRLVDALYSQDGCCIEDVDWDNLLEHRSGDLCQQRWAEMSRNLGDYREKPFLEQLEVLHQRYDKALIEAREIYEKKDPVDDV